MIKATCYTDGASRGNPGEASIGVVIEHHATKKIFKFSEYLGNNLTNNYAEYKAIIFCLERLKEANIDSFELFTDSNLAVQQINGKFKVNNSNIVPLFKEVKELLKDFKEYSFTHVKREKNKLADQLANQALDKRKE